MSDGGATETLPPGWAVTTLDSVIDPKAPIIYGILQPGPEVPDGVPYVRPTEIVGDRIELNSVRKTSPLIAQRFGRSSLEAGDVLLSIVGTIGKVAPVPSELLGGNITQSSVRLRPSMGLIEGRYLEHQLRSPWMTKQYAALQLGTGVPRLNVGDVRSLRFALAPPNEQRRIVAKLDQLLARSRAAREALDAVPAMLEQYRKSVLAAAFRGELTAGWHAARPRTPLSAGFAEEERPPRPARYDTRSRSVIPGDFALSVGMPDRPAPPGWRWVPLVDVARLESGHTPSRNHPEWWGGDVPWIGIRDARIHHGSTIMETEQFTNNAGLANSAARLLPTGTVCLSRTASVGYVVVMGRPMATSQDFVNWVCTRSVDPHWLKCLFLAEHDSIWRFGKGSTHTTVYFPEVLSFHVCLPPIDEQREIVRRVEAALARIERVKAAVDYQRAQLDALDRAILDKAFRGELVPQDPSDEPAAVMLERLRAEREASETKAPKKKGARKGGKQS